MKLLRSQKDYFSRRKKRFSEHGYFICCILAPLISSLAATGLGIIAKQWISTALLILSTVFVLVQIYLLRTKIRYCEDKFSQLVKQNDCAVPLSRRYPFPIPDFQPIKTYYFSQNKKLTKVKFCFACKVFKPPNTVHCSKCNECCINFDHHCSWLKMCIGGSNYKSFILFLLGMSVQAAIVFSNSFFVWQKDQDMWIVKSVLTSLSFLISFFIVGFVTILMCFHLFLWFKGQSTYQFIKKRYKQQIFGKVSPLQRHSQELRVVEVEGKTDS